MWRGCSTIWFGVSTPCKSRGYPTTKDKVMKPYSEYYKKLQRKAILHFKAHCIHPDMRIIDGIPYPIEIEHARQSGTGIVYSARAVFGDGCYSHWYDIRFEESCGSDFVLFGTRVHGVFKDPYPRAFVDVFLLNWGCNFANQ